MLLLLRRLINKTAERRPSGIRIVIQYKCQKSQVYLKITFSRDIQYNIYAAQGRKIVAIRPCDCIGQCHHNFSQNTTCVWVEAL